MSRRSLGGLVVVAMLLAGQPSVAVAQTSPAVPYTPPAGGGEDGAGQPASLALATPVIQVGLLVGGAWIGSILARRLVNSSWVSLIGARIGAGLGLEAAASLGLLGIGVGGALPASRVVAPQLISAPGSAAGP